MRSIALRVGLRFMVLTLLAPSCGDSRSTPNDGKTEAGAPSDGAAPPKDGITSRTDVRDLKVADTVEVVDTLPGDTPLGDVPLSDDAALPPVSDGPNVEPAKDGGLVDPGEDAPIGGVTEAGATVDGMNGEAGVPPLVYPDGGLVCGQAGASCQSAADCCGLACVANRCAASACLSDGTACTLAAECCSTMCGADGMCTPLNPTCKTAGNACSTGGDCCSGLCNADKQCAQPGEVSYCAQIGDICRGDSQCCTGVCNVAAGAAVGTCAVITTSSSCQIDGTVCNGCGTCCSRFCGPFGMSDSHICQPASGCHVQGDLCHQDSDCCGGDPRSGLPGAGLVKCEPDPVYGGRIGSCGGPSAGNCPDGTSTCKNTCNPEGNVCHYKDTWACSLSSDSKRANCCACVSGKECCKLDRMGIPRCNALDACVPTGGSCSFSGECCNDLPCVPEPVTGQLKCGSSCVSNGGLCTTNADCCTGMLCEVPPGSLDGVCTVPTVPPVILPDGGVPETDGGEPKPDGSTPEPDASTTEPDAPPVCAFYGQSCSLSVACCGDVTCVNASFSDCTAADTHCFCFIPE